VVLFYSFQNHGFENASMGTLDYEIVHDVSFSHLQEDYEQELISIHSFEIQNDSPQTNFQNCLMNKRIALMHIIWLSYLKMFKNV
jgi:hypothetical protein